MRLTQQIATSDKQMTITTTITPEPKVLSHLEELCLLAEGSSDQIRAYQTRPGAGGPRRVRASMVLSIEPDMSV